jgi:DNA replication protein DnaC
MKENCENGFIYNPENRSYRECPIHKKIRERQEAVRTLQVELPKKFWNKSFKNFETTNKELKEFKETAIKYAKAKAWNNGSSLFINGNYGTGKTHIAAAITRQAIYQGQSVLFLTGSRLTGTIEEIRDKFKKMKNLDLIILDDLGEEIKNKIILNEIFSLINHRYEAEKGFIITTNKSPEEFESQLIGGRTFDRIYERSLIITLEETKSMRKQKREKYLEWLNEVKHEDK